MCMGGGGGGSGGGGGGAGGGFGGFSGFDFGIANTNIGGADTFSNLQPSPMNPIAKYKLGEGGKKYLGDAPQYSEDKLKALAGTAGKSSLTIG